MNLYLLSQKQNSGYDTYDSCVVAARDENEAKRISPAPYYKWLDEQNAWYFSYPTGKSSLGFHSSWANELEAIKVECIGEANKETEAGVICASFNAG